MDNVEVVNVKNGALCVKSIIFFCERRVGWLMNMDMESPQTFIFGEL